MKYILLLCLSATGLFVHAQKVNPPAVNSTTFYNTAIVQIKPVYKNYVTQTARAFKNRKLNADSLRAAIKVPNNSAFSNLSNADVETLLLLVMQSAEADAYADIKNMLAEMEKNKKRKEALHDEEERIKKAANTEVYADIKNMMTDMEKNRQKKDSLGKAATQINKTQSRAGDQNKIQVPVYNTDQAKRLAAIKKEKDAIDEMTQQDMLQLQQMMEKKSQLESMISNIMKAAGDTQSGLSSALKAS